MARFNACLLVSRFSGHSDHPRLMFGGSTAVRSTNEVAGGDRLYTITPRQVILPDTITQSPECASSNSEAAGGAERGSPADEPHEIGDRELPRHSRR